MNLKSQVIGALRWTAAGRLAGQLGTWVVTIYVIRLLSPEDYGLMGIAAVLMGLAALNKWRFVPAIRAGASGSLPSLQRSMAVEWSVMVLVFFTTAVLTGFFSPGH